MTPLDQAVFPLRQRMLDDMRMRKLAGKTQAAYVRALYRLVAFLQRSPDTASAEDLRRFQLDMVDGGASPITVNATITGLKFFFDVTLDRAELMRKMQPVHVPHVLPVVLSRDEVAQLIAAAPNLQYRAALSLAYGAGLRASEVASLKVRRSARHLRVQANMTDIRLQQSHPPTRPRRASAGRLRAWLSIERDLGTPRPAHRPVGALHPGVHCAGRHRQHRHDPGFGIAGQRASGLFAIRL